MQTSSEKLKEIILNQGMRNTYLADKCGISRTAYYKKLNGKTVWTAPEIAVMKRELHLTLSQVNDIFLL